jgi:hypothetical protein
MNWQSKAALYRLFERAPFGRQLHYAAQRYVTRTLPRRVHPTAKVAAEFERHLTAFLAAKGTVNNLTYFEFGAGWDLYSNIYLWTCGLDRQLVVDLNPHARAELINGVCAALREDPPAFAVRLPNTGLPNEFEETLKDAYGIDYRAPADAAELADVPDGSIDLIATTGTLQQIPVESLRRILRNCRRICRSDAVISMSIDYCDQYSRADPSVSVYNYLRFTTAEWERFNPPNNYQNRLRHSDYTKLFEEAGFQVVSDEPFFPPEAEMQLANVPVDNAFRRYTTDELLPVRGYFLMRPAT